jgi:N-acylneuraminate cytidylyltransferase
MQKRVVIGRGETSKAKGVLGLIAARGGSKGLPRKNILIAAKKPLIAWTIAAAIESNMIDRVILSSDDDEIIQVAKDWGCEVPFIRPAELARDTSRSMDVVLHALDQVHGFEYIVLLQPTSPLRTARDIDAAFDFMRNHNAPACVSVTEVDQSPYWMYQLNADDRLIKIVEPIHEVIRRQDLPPVYTLNGAIYIAKIDWLLESRSFVGPKTVAYQMPKARSIDIDDALDFQQFRQFVESPEYTNSKAV